MSSGHAWCQVVKILRGHTWTGHLSRRGRQGCEHRALESSAWPPTARATRAGGGVWEAGERRNPTLLQLRTASPLPGLPATLMEAEPRSCPPATDVLGRWEGGQASAHLVPLALVAGALWPPKLVHLALDVHHPLPLLLGAQQVVGGRGALGAVALLPRRG